MAVLRKPCISSRTRVVRSGSLPGVLASALAFAVQTHVQQRLSATRTAIILTMEPVFAVFFGYLLAGDRLSWVQIVGALLILAAIAASEVLPALKRN